MTRSTALSRVAKQKRTLAINLAADSAKQLWAAARWSLCIDSADAKEKNESDGGAID